MRKSVVLFLLIVFTIGAFAQNLKINIKTSVYFDTDSFALTNEHLQKLEKIADTAHKLKINGILIRGNTDADADSMYNIRLSAKRTNSVKQYFISQGITDTLLHTDFYGENKPIADNETDKGKQKNRRVDVILSAEIYQSLEDPPKDIIDSCNQDTTFTLPYGSIVTMNKCEFLEQSNCGGFEITEFVTPQVVQDSGLNTMDTEQNILISGGMYSIKVCNGKCIKKPITIMLLIKEGCEPPCTMGVWESANGWIPSKDLEVKIVKQDKKRYYKITFLNLCGIKFNFDCRPSYQPLTIKLPRKYKILSVKITNDCPIWVFEKNYKNKRKIKICAPCQDIANATIYLKALTPNGDTIIINSKRFSDFRLRNQFFVKDKCNLASKKKNCSKKWLIFGRKKSKVKIRRKDFERYNELIN